MKNKIFKEILNEIKEKGIDVYNCDKLNCFNTFSEQFYKDIEKFSKYTFDGRFQTILKIEGETERFKITPQFRNFYHKSIDNKILYDGRVING